MILKGWHLNSWIRKRKQILLLNTLTNFNEARNQSLLKAFFFNDVSQNCQYCFKRFTSNFNSSRPNHGRRGKNKLNFLFHTNLLFISMQLSEMHGTERVNPWLRPYKNSYSKNFNIFISYSFNYVQQLILLFRM